jgi:hypothetical protein
MATRWNLLPVEWTEWPNVLPAPWQTIPNATPKNHLRDIDDGRYLRTDINAGGYDSNGVGGTLWYVDGATLPDWTDKVITNIEFYFNGKQGQAIQTALQIVVANKNDIAHYQELFNNVMTVNGGNTWQFVAGGAVNPPGTYLTWRDYARDWILSQALAFSFLHYNHGHAVYSDFSLDAQLVAVDWDVSPSAATGELLITEF